MSNLENHNTRQSGFTLIELMISLVLGLLISAAVMQVYLISVKTSSVQASGSELQDASIFGIQQLEKKVRLANLGNPATRIDSTTAKGGIVLTGANLAVALPYTDTGYLTRRAGDSASGTNGWTGASNTTVASDQLTIQYTNITGSPFSDCEGATVEINETAVERYFLRPVTNDTSSGAIKNLVLACDGGRVTNTTPATIATYGGSDTRNFGKAGQDFITNVDQFKVLLGTQSDSGSTAGQLMYLPSNSYLDITGNKPAITAVKMGLIVHGSTPVLGSEDQTSFVLLGQSNNLKNDTSRSKQVRTTYETTTLLRNARVVNVKTGL